MIDPAVHQAAWWYYQHGLTQDVIAGKLGVSRATVVKHLRIARESGVVNIRVSNELFRHDVMARTLEDRFSLDGVWVVDDAAGALPFAPVGASVLIDRLQPGTRIALAWGQTVYAVVDALPQTETNGVSIAQMCGNLDGPFDYLPDQCTLEMARKLGARGQNLYAPLILGSEALAKALREEPIVSHQLKALKQSDVAVFSIGSVESDSHIVRCGAIGKRELANCRREGACGVVAGRLIDRQGQALDCSYNRRLVSTGLDTIRSIPERLVLVEEIEKVTGLRAAIETGLVSHLVISAGVADGLVDRD